MGHNVMRLSPGLSHGERAWLLLNSGAHGIQILSQKTPEPRVPLLKKVPPGSVVTAIRWVAGLPTYWLCDLGQVTQLLCTGVLICVYCEG